MGAKEEHMPNRLWIAKLILGSLVFAVSAPAQRPYLWVATRIIGAPGVNTCLSIAQTAMNGQVGLHEVTRQGELVSGITEKSYAVITCIEGSNQQMTAVIMVTSNDRTESEQLKNSLADRMARIKGL